MTLTGEIWVNAEISPNNDDMTEASTITHSSTSTSTYKSTSSTRSSKITKNMWDSLCDKVTALSALNHKTFEDIQNRNVKGEKVIRGYTYNVSLDLGNHLNSPQPINKTNLNLDDEKKNKIKPWSIQSQLDTVEITDLIDQWKYKGVPLQEGPPSQFGNINLSLETYRDIPRLTLKFKDLSIKYVHVLGDTTQTRQGLEILLLNMEILQVALEELLTLTVDSDDVVDRDDPDITKEMEQLVAAFDALGKKLPHASLKYNGTSATTATRTTQNSKDVGKNFNIIPFSFFRAFNPSIDRYLGKRHEN